MSDQHYITPVKHSAASATGAQVAGTAGGALKGGLGAAALWVLGFTVAFAVLGAVIATPGGIAAIIGTAGTAASAGGVGTAASGLLGLVTNPLTWGIGLGGALGAVLGLGSSWLPGGAGAIFGGLKGHQHASERVNNERAAAVAVETQLTAARAMSASVPTQVNVGFPEQGSRFNQASSSIQADSALNQGRMDQLQLQRA